MKNRRGHKAQFCNHSLELEMACGVTFAFRPAMVRADAIGSRDRRRKGGGNSGGAWWSPLFGWRGEPDYIESGEKGADRDSALCFPEDRQRKHGLLTEEKARELRMRITETESFHDAMYHSAIASRLASDVRRRSGSWRRDGRNPAGLLFSISDQQPHIILAFIFARFLEKKRGYLPLSGLYKVNATKITDSFIPVPLPMTVPLPASSCKLEFLLPLLSNLSIPV